MVKTLIIIFKFIEPLFWLAQAWLLLCLSRPKPSFEANVKLVNKLLILQGFDTQLPLAEKAFKIWRRDLGIIFFLNLLVIILIHLI